MIAGQGTLGLELLEQVPDADAVVVPVGGGGLIAGVATVWHALKPGLQVIGVEPANAACFAAGLAAGAPMRVPTKFTLADGLAVVEAGRNALSMTRPLVHKLVQVSRGRTGAWRSCGWRNWRSASSRARGAAGHWRRC